MSTTTTNTVIINSTNQDQSKTNKFVYKFPQHVKFDKGSSVALQSISMYNSIFNVESARSNNKCSVKWNANTTVQYDFTIPDGFYTIPQLNYFIQQQCVLNNLYCVNANGDFVYFVELLINATRYACQINSYYLPTSANATTLGYTIPAGASWSFPASNKNIQFIVPTTGFGDLLGFTAQTLPSSVGSTNQQFLSNTTPQIAVVNSIILSCNLIQSKYTNPINVFYSIPIKVGFGSLIDVSNSAPIYNSITEGYYSQIEIQFLDQNFNNLTLHDPDLVITLSIVS